MSEIKLYSFLTSPFVAKVHCYLLYKQVPFELVYVNPLRAEKELPVGHQVPVLQVGDECVRDSRDIGYFIEKHYNPDKPMVLKGMEQAIDQLEDWINDTFVPVLFQMVRPQLFDFAKIANAWRLGYCVSQTARGGLPLFVRVLWPYFLNRAHFIRMPADRMAAQGSTEENRKRVLEHIENQFQGQQYLLTNEQPCMPDISLFALLVVPYSLGLRQADDIHEYTNIMDWLSRMSQFFQASELPALIPDALITRNKFLGKSNA